MTRRCVSFAEERSISDLQAEIDRLNRLIRERTVADSASAFSAEAAEPNESKAVDIRGNKAADFRDRSADFHVESTGHHLSHLTQRGEAILDHWAETDRRYAQAVRAMESRLSEWQTIESRLRQESLERMKAFEQTIAREWRELREVHEEPLKQLRDQAAALGETSVAAANLALRGYERAEARLASLEADLRGQLSQLSREVHATLAEIRHERGLGGRPTPAPFQLDSVMKLHSELRDAPSAGPELANVPAQKSATAPPKPAAVPTVPAVEPVRVPEIPAPTEPAETSAAAAFAAREPFSTLKSSAPASTGSVVRIVYPRRAWRVIPVAIAVAVIAAGIFGFVRLQRGTAIGDSPAQAAAQASAGTSAQGTSSTASRDALDPANGAALAADVITSPDVIRFAMTGVGGGRGASGQVLWSRSKGIVLTASSLPAPEAGSAYRFWLLSDTHAVPVGRLQPDETGRVRLAAPNPSGLPNLIDSVAVTLEAEGSTAASPSTNTILRRAYP